MKRVGLVEVGLFSSSLLLLGLVIWFFSLTFFGSSNDSQAQIASWAMSPASAARINPGMRSLKEPNLANEEEQKVLRENQSLSSEPIDKSFNSEDCVFRVCNCLSLG